MNTLLVSAYLLSAISQYTTGIESFPEYAKHRKTVSFAKTVSDLRFLAFTTPVSIQALKSPQPLQMFKEPTYLKPDHFSFSIPFQSNLKPDHFPLSFPFESKRKSPTPKTHFAIKFTSTEIPLNKTLHLSEGIWDKPPHGRKRTLLTDVASPLPFWYTE